jgi:hypothetical protein
MQGDVEKERELIPTSILLMKKGQRMLVRSLSSREK